MALRIEAFAEPMFAASIITYGVFVGAADTLVPCLMNFFNIRAVRLSLAALLAPSLGLKSVWVAMCIKLCFRGLIFLVRLKRERWMRHMWKSHATLTLLAKQDLPTFGYNMIDPLKSWCWGAILFYPFKISRFS